MLLGVLAPGLRFNACLAVGLPFVCRSLGWPVASLPLGCASGVFAAGLPLAFSPGRYTRLWALLVLACADTLRCAAPLGCCACVRWAAPLRRLRCAAPFVAAPLRTSVWAAPAAACALGWTAHALGHWADFLSPLGCRGGSSRRAAGLRFLAFAAPQRLVTTCATAHFCPLGCGCDCRRWAALLAPLPLGCTFVRFCLWAGPPAP